MVKLKTVLALISAAFYAGCTATDGPIESSLMQAIYEEVKTPYKFGMVIEPPEGKMVDCPTVFRHNGRWYMIYVQLENDPAGYTTQLAQSDDLLHWTPLGTILPRSPEGAWDSRQAAGGIALFDTRWGGSNRLQTYDGKYWLTYFGGSKDGYETPPLSIGVAWTDDPSALRPWTRLPGPVLTSSDPDVRPFEDHTLFKSHVIRDPSKSLGHPFVMFYNAHTNRGAETIGIAVSDDMLRWKRLGAGPVIANPSMEAPKGISGDPQITRIGNLWVMFYFGAFWKPGAFDTFACSRDLLHWTNWQGPDLIASSEPWDRKFAHKPWVLKHDGVVYHFYCAVGDRGRGIALATSKDLHTKVEQ